MPWCCDADENQETGKWPQLAPTAPSPGDRYKDKDGCCWENNAHQTPCQNRNSTKRGRSPVAEAWLKTSGPRPQKQVKDRDEFESAHRFLIHGPRENEQAGAAGQNQNCI